MAGDEAVGVVLAVFSNFYSLFVDSFLTLDSVDCRIRFTKAGFCCIGGSWMDTERNVVNFDVRPNSVS